MKILDQIKKACLLLAVFAVSLTACNKLELDPTPNEPPTQGTTPTLATLLYLRAEVPTLVSRVVIQVARHGQELPLTETHQRLLEIAESAGYGDADNSAVIRAFEHFRSVRQDTANQNNTNHQVTSTIFGKVQHE